MITLKNKTILSEWDFRIKNNADIKQISEQSFLCVKINLSKFLNDGNELYMSNTPDVLGFYYTDNSKPEEYYEPVFNENRVFDFEKGGDDLEEIGCVLRTHQKHRLIQYKYPYYKKVSPARMIEDTIGIFGTGNYTFVKESSSKAPDYDAVERIMYEVFETLKAYK